LPPIQLTLTLIAPNF